jgi:hypothetical protein
MLLPCGRLDPPWPAVLNHSPETGCEFTYDDTDEPPSFVVELPDGKKAGEMPRTPGSGEQLWLDYGAQTSEELWLMYGFVPSKPTPHDRAILVGAYADVDVQGAPGDEEMMEEKRALVIKQPAARKRSSPWPGVPYPTHASCTSPLAMNPRDRFTTLAAELMSV